MDKFLDIFIKVEDENRIGGAESNEVNHACNRETDTTSPRPSAIVVRVRAPASKKRRRKKKKKTISPNFGYCVSYCECGRLIVCVAHRDSENVKRVKERIYSYSESPLGAGMFTFSKGPAPLVYIYDFTLAFGWFCRSVSYFYFPP